MTSRERPGWSQSHVLPLAALVVAVAVGPPASATTPPADSSIDAWVKEALREDPRVEPAKVDVAVEDGVVTLEGTVDDLAARRFAVRETQKIEGVRGVIDDLSVRSGDRPDAEIAGDVVARLWGSPDLGPRQLDVDVGDGIVTLRGTVENYGEKREAELLASEVRSVRGVRNDLALHYASGRPDEAILTDVKAALSRDVYLAGLPIEAKIHQGQVTLSGSVGNAYQRERASDDAWVPNVTDVKNDLEVKWSEDRGVRNKGRLPSDAAVAEAVHAVLYQDLHIQQPFAVNVDASRGQVTLRGTVPTYDQKLRAVADSKDVVGVVQVNDDLTVRPSWRTDAAIRKDVLARLHEDYLLYDRDIGVDVRDGVVTLSGTVDSYRDRGHAIRVASRVPGVVDVTDHVHVAWTTQFDDAVLKSRIVDRLRRNGDTRWIADRLGVRVDDGVVRLNGDALNWDERLEAGRIAANTEGVRWVDNQITVDGVDYPWDELYLPHGGDEYLLSAR